MIYAPIQFDTTFSPIGLWHLNGNMSDSSGQGNHLSVHSGTARWTEIFPGTRAFHFDGSSLLGLSSSAANPAILNLTGAMTAQFLCCIGDVFDNLNVTFLQYTAPGENDASNTQYSVKGHGNIRRLMYVAESGTVAADQALTGTEGLIQGFPYHVALVRSLSGDVIFYVNGRLAMSSSGLSLPTGGQSGSFYLGADPNVTNSFKGAIAGVKLNNTMLSSTDLLDEYNRTIGRYWPRITP